MAITLSALRTIVRRDLRDSGATTTWSNDELNSSATLRQILSNHVHLLRIRLYLSTISFLTEIQEGHNLGTRSAEVSIGCTGGMGSIGMLVGYLLGHRRVNSGVHWGWKYWVSLGPWCTGIPALVPLSGSIDGDQATDGGITWWQC